MKCSSNIAVRRNIFLLLFRRERVNIQQEESGMCKAPAMRLWPRANFTVHARVFPAFPQPAACPIENLKHRQKDVISCTCLIDPPYAH
jgi:hypothetical protein